MKQVLYYVICLKAFHYDFRIKDTMIIRINIICFHGIYVLKIQKLTSNSYLITLPSYI